MCMYRCPVLVRLALIVVWCVVTRAVIVDPALVVPHVWSVAMENSCTTENARMIALWAHVRRVSHGCVWV